MSGLDSNALEIVIERGIKHPIRLMLEAHCYAAAIVLTYSGMDTLAFLNMPGNRMDVMRSDFIAWAEQYVKLPPPDPPTGRDLYGTRCTVLHGGAPSRFTREGRGRLLRHGAGTVGGRAQVSATELAHAFFAGIDRFLCELMNDPARVAVANRRLEELKATGAYD